MAGDFVTKLGPGLVSHLILPSNSKLDDGANRLRL